MKKNLRNSLFESGILNRNAEQIDAFKKEHRKKYQQDYNKDLAKKLKRKAILFTEEEFNYLLDQAKLHSNMKLAPFLREVIFAYLSGSFISPNKDSISNIEFLLRNIQNKVSNYSQHLFKSELTLEDIQGLKNQIKELDDFTRKALNNPPRLETWLESQIENDELFLQKLLTTIAHYIS